MENVVIGIGSVHNFGDLDRGLEFGFYIHTHRHTIGQRKERYQRGRGVREVSGATGSRWVYVRRAVVFAAYETRQVCSGEGRGSRQSARRVIRSASRSRAPGECGK